MRFVITLPLIQVAGEEISIQAGEDIDILIKQPDFIPQRLDYKSVRTGLKEALTCIESLVEQQKDHCSPEMAALVELINKRLIDFKD